MNRVQRLLSHGPAALRERLGFRPRVVPAYLLDHRLLVAEGVVRTPPDYDEAWFLACSMNAEVVFDVGANQGQAALIALICPNVKQVTLIEPNPEALIVAAENLIRNRFSARARFICAFVSDVSGAQVRLWTVGRGAAGSMYSDHAKSATQSIEVPTVTIDDVIGSSVPVPDLIKIDVEGAEGLALSGARRCAAHKKTRFLVEMHSNADLSMKVNVDGVLRWCAELGHEAWYLAKGELLTKSDPVSHRGRFHLLLQPAGWPYPSWLRGIPQQAALECALGKDH